MVWCASSSLIFLLNIVVRNNSAVCVLLRLISQSFFVGRYFVNYKIAMMNCVRWKKKYVETLIKIQYFSTINVKQWWNKLWKTLIRWSVKTSRHSHMWGLCELRMKNLKNTSKSPSSTAAATQSIAQWKQTTRCGGATWTNFAFVTQSSYRWIEYLVRK